MVIYFCMLLFSILLLIYINDSVSKGQSNNRFGRLDLFHLRSIVLILSAFLGGCATSLQNVFLDHDVPIIFTPLFFDYDGNFPHRGKLNSCCKYIVLLFG